LTAVAVCSLAMACIGPREARADQGLGIAVLEGANGAAEVDLPKTGWKGFTDFENVGNIAVALLLAAALGALMAYHPRTFGRASTLEEGDQPKIIIMYGVVGCIVAEIVVAFPAMAIVIFAIGGLMRFRTDVGPARDTGRVILVTLIGLCCGLKIYVMAALATAFGWAMIYVLDGRVTHRLLVKGLEAALIAQSSEAYEEVLLENGFRILSQKKNFVKAQVAFIFRAPQELDREQLEFLFKDIPPKLQGAVDWESN
jgi:hypothetical protein